MDEISETCRVPELFNPMGNFPRMKFGNWMGRDGRKRRANDETRRVFQDCLSGGIKAKTEIFVTVSAVGNKLLTSSKWYARVIGGKYLSTEITARWRCKWRMPVRWWWTGAEFRCCWTEWNFLENVRGCPLKGRALTHTLVRSNKQQSREMEKYTAEFGEVKDKGTRDWWHKWPRLIHVGEWSYGECATGTCLTETRAEAVR